MAKGKISRKRQRTLEYICVNNCKALCCQNGVDLNAEEERKIRQVVAKYPQLFPGLPDEYLVHAPLEHQPGKWGTRFALKEHMFFPACVELPEGFKNTICVFCNDQGLCQLHGAALTLKIPVASLKPYECLVFPLLYVDAHLYSPLTPDNQIREFPGKNYRMHLLDLVPCIRRKPPAQSWKEYAGVDEAAVED